MTSETNAAESRSAELHRLASLIPQYGFLWAEDGPTLLQIIALLYAEIPTDAALTVAEKKAYLVIWLFRLDRRYGWDAKNMDQATEDQFYRFFVDLWFRDQKLA